MAIRTMYGALLLSSLAIGGCGTVVNVVKPGPVEGGKAPFGGVRQDVVWFKTAENGELCLKTPPRSEPEQHPQVALMLLSAADLPFSLLGDLVTWPYVVAYSYINQPVPVPPVAQPPIAGPPHPAP